MMFKKILTAVIGLSVLSISPSVAGATATSCSPGIGVSAGANKQIVHLNHKVRWNVTVWRPRGACRITDVFVTFTYPIGIQQIMNGPQPKFHYYNGAPYPITMLGVNMTTMSVTAQSGGSAVSASTAYTVQGVQ